MINIKTTIYSDEVEKINTRMYRRRLDPNYNFFAHGWTMYSMREIKPMKPRDKIKSLLDQGYIVSSGYFCTSVRGYHDYYIMYKSMY